MREEKEGAQELTANKATCLVAPEEHVDANKGEKSPSAQDCASKTPQGKRRQWRADERDVCSIRCDVLETRHLVKGQS